MKFSNIIRFGLMIFTVIVLALSMVQAVEASHAKNDAGRYDDQHPKVHSSAKKVYDNNVKYYKQYHSPSRNYAYGNAYRRGYDHGYHDGYYTGRYVERRYHNYQHHYDSRSSKYKYRSYDRYHHNSYDRYHRTSYSYKPSRSYVSGYSYHRSYYPVGYHRTASHYRSY